MYKKTQKHFKLKITNPSPFLCKKTLHPVLSLIVAGVTRHPARPGGGGDQVGHTGIRGIFFYDVV